jgi:uncharacterized protein YceK
MSGPFSPDQKFTTHTIHIPLKHSNILLYRTLIHAKSDICITKFVEDATSAISLSVAKVKITGNFCHTISWALREGCGTLGVRYIGGSSYIINYMSACMESDKDADWLIHIFNVRSMTLSLPF